MSNDKSMVSLNIINAEWTKDAALISDSENAVALDLIPKMHAKYNAMMGKNVFLAKIAYGEYSRLYKLKHQYLRGDLNADTDLLKSLGWVPLQKKIDNSHIKIHLEGDEKLLELKWNIDHYTLLAESCKEIIAAVRARGYGLNAKIKWQTFTFDGTE